MSIFRSRLFVLVIIGLSIGILVAYDFNASKYLTSRLKYLGFHYEIIEKPVPYSFLTIFFLLIISLCLLIASFPKIYKNKELFFLILFLFALQNSALLNIFFIDGSDIIVGIFLLIWLIEIFYRREEYYFVRTPINLINLLFLFSLLLSSINGFTLKIFFSFAKAAMLFLILVNIFTKKELVIEFIKWLIVVTTISAIIGILQEIVYLYTKGLVLALVSEEMIYYEMKANTMFFKITAFMGNYKLFAMILSFNLITIINILLYPSPLVTDKKERIFLYFALLLMFCALILTFSKDSLMATCIGIIISIFLRWKYLFIHFVIAVMLLFILSFLSGFLESVYKYIIFETHAGEFADRVQFVNEGIEGFLHGPFLIGIGAGEGGRYTSNQNDYPVHNAFILIADELGIFGLFVYLSLFIFAIYRLVFINLAAKQLQDKVISKGLFCGFMAYSIILQFHAQYVEILLWIYLGIIEGMALKILSKQYTASQV